MTKHTTLRTTALATLMVLALAACGESAPNTDSTPAPTQSAAAIASAEASPSQSAEPTETPLPSFSAVVVPSPSGTANVGDDPDIDFPDETVIGTAEFFADAEELIEGFSYSLSMFELDEFETEQIGDTTAYTAEGANGSAIVVIGNSDGGVDAIRIVDARPEDGVLWLAILDALFGQGASETSFAIGTVSDAADEGTGITRTQVFGDFEVTIQAFDGDRPDQVVVDVKPAE